MSQKWEPDVHNPAPVVPVTYLLKGDEREVAIGLLRRALIFVPEGSTVHHDVSVFLDRLDDPVGELEGDG